MGGAIVVFTLVLYPYVFLLARAALADQAGSAYNVARASAPDRSRQRSCRDPDASTSTRRRCGRRDDGDDHRLRDRPYFGVDTVTVGVFRIWRGTFDRDAASEFATLVLVVALMIIGLERIMRGRARFGEAAGAAAGSGPVASRACERGPPLPSAASCCSCVPGPDSPARVVGIPRDHRAEGHPEHRTLPRVPRQLPATRTPHRRRVRARLDLHRQRVTIRLRPNDRPRCTAHRCWLCRPGAGRGDGCRAQPGCARRRARGHRPGSPGTVATGSLVGLVYAYSIRFLAPGLNAIEAGMAQVPEEITASARSLGARPATIVRRIHTPSPARASPPAPFSWLSMH